MELPWSAIYQWIYSSFGETICSVCDFYGDSFDAISCRGGLDLSEGRAFWTPVISGLKGTDVFYNSIAGMA